ncbi:hypothetical protein L7F22_008629 [Adiantum nelumboides]|nr:hypothetical protein [Adiantum nelumboides]
MRWSRVEVCPAGCRSSRRAAGGRPVRRVGGGVGADGRATTAVRKSETGRASSSGFRESAVWGPNRTPVASRRVAHRGSSRTEFHGGGYLLRPGDSVRPARTVVPTGGGPGSFPPRATVSGSAPVPLGNGVGLRLGEPGQQVAQPGPLGVVERGEELGGQRTGLGRGPGGQAFALVGEVDQPSSLVGLGARAGQPAVAFHPAQQLGGGALVGRGERSERDLVDPGAPAQRVEHRVLRLGQLRDALLPGRGVGLQDPAEQLVHELVGRWSGATRRGNHRRDRRDPRDPSAGGAARRRGRHAPRALEVGAGDDRRGDRLDGARGRGAGRDRAPVRGPGRVDLVRLVPHGRDGRRPCSMKTLAQIRHGIADGLVARAADVTIKEDRKLVLVPRETPLSEIHLENMLALRRTGVRIVPPMPAFYNHPAAVDDVVDHVVARICDQFDLPAPRARRWTGGSARQRRSA